MCARSELGEKEKSGKGKERKGGEKARKTNALDKVPQRVKQAQPARDDGHGGALAAGDDQGVALLQLLGRAHLGEGELERILLSFLLVLLLGRGRGGGDDVVGGPAQQRQVLDDAALEGQDADGDGLDGHGKARARAGRARRQCDSYSVFLDAVGYYNTISKLSGSLGESKSRTMRLSVSAVHSPKIDSSSLITRQPWQCPGTLLISKVPATDTKEAGILV